MDDKTIILTHRQVREMLFAECERAGGVRQLAAEAKIAPSAISMVLTHARTPSPSILNALGYMVLPQMVCAPIRGKAVPAAGKGA